MAKKRRKNPDHIKGLVIMAILALLLGGPPGLMLFMIVVACVKLFGG